MKIILGKHNKPAIKRAGDARRAVVLDLSLESLPKFKGFAYTVAEGLRLAERSFTEIPGLARKHK